MARRLISIRIDNRILSELDKEAAKRRQEAIDWSRNRALENALYEFYFGKRRRRVM